MGTGIVTWDHKVPEREPARQASRHGGMLEPSAPRKNRCLGLSWPRGQREVSLSELYSGSQFSPAVGVRKCLCCTLGYTGLPPDLAAKENSRKESGGHMKGAHTWPPALPSIKFSRWLLLLALLTLRLGGPAGGQSRQDFLQAGPFPRSHPPFALFSSCSTQSIVTPPTHTPHPIFPALGKLIHLCGILAKSPSAILCVCKGRRWLAASLPHTPQLFSSQTKRGQPPHLPFAQQLAITPHMDHSTPCPPPPTSAALWNLFFLSLLHTHTHTLPLGKQPCPGVPRLCSKEAAAGRLQALGPRLVYCRPLAGYPGIWTVTSSLDLGFPISKVGQPFWLTTVRECKRKVQNL